MKMQRVDKGRIQSIWNLLLVLGMYLLSSIGVASHAAGPMVEDVPKQPLVVHVNRLMQALEVTAHPILVAA